MNKGSLMLAAQVLGVSMEPFGLPDPKRRRGGKPCNGRLPVNGSYLAPLATRVGGKTRKRSGKKGGRR